MLNPPAAPEPPSPSRRRFSVAWVWAVAAGCVALFVVAARARDAVLYNHSPSIPVGLYLRADAPIERGVIVTVRARDVALTYANQRAFTDDGDRFIKRVVGVAGDTVCAEGSVVTLDGWVTAHRQERDSAGRLLPSWSGCRTLTAGELLLLGDTEDSFDGRYWGPVHTAQIEGVWRPLFADSSEQVTTMWVTGRMWDGRQDKRAARGHPKRLRALSFARPVRNSTARATGRGSCERVE